MKYFDLLKKRDEIIQENTLQEIFYTLIPMLFMASALSPYIGNSVVKMEYLVIYGIGFIILIFGRSTPLRRIRMELNTFTLLWLYFLITEVLGMIWSLLFFNKNVFSGKVFAAVEHQLQPLVVMFVISFIATMLRPDDLKKALTITINVLLVGLSINTIMIFIMIITQNIEIFGPWLPLDWRDIDQVWMQSLQMFRYNGIFNQPFESGLSYSFGLIAWCYIQIERSKTNIIQYLVLILLLVGGTASISKVFILVGLPIFLCLILIHPSYRKKIIWNRNAFIISIVSVFIFVYLLEYWEGYDFFLRLFNPEKGQDLVDLYTANRFGGEETQVTTYMSEVISKSPILGYGFAPFDVLDSALLWALGGGGIFGLGVFLLFVMTALIASIKVLIKNSDSILPLLLISTAMMAALGAPAFTVNRASTIFWITFPLAYMVASNEARKTSVKAGNENGG